MHGRLNRRLRAAGTEGFTLIELLIVIVILGILAAIVVFAIGKTRGDAVNSSCKTNAKQVQLSEEAVKTKTGSYATSSAQLLGTGTAGGLMKAMPITTGDYSITFTSGSATDYTFTIAPVGASTVPTTGITTATTDDQLNTACTPT